MNRYIKRIGQGVITLFTATTVAFVLFRMMPGGPVLSLARSLMIKCRQRGRANCEWQEIYERVERQVQIDPSKSIPEAYLDFLNDVLLHGDFGQSTAYQQEVFDLLFQAMPWSIMISLFGLALGWTFNIFWGAALAYKEGSRFDKAGTVFSLVGSSIPYFVAAVIALAIFGYTFHLFPTGGRWPSQIALKLPVVGVIFSEPNVTPGFNLPFMIGVIWHASLPIFTGFVLGINGLTMRGNSIRVMESDYMRAARLRGLSPVRIANRYVARNAVLPLYTKLMVGIAAIFSSSIVTEMIFSYPAVGWYTFQALVNRDYPLLMGSFVFFTTITIIGILFADFTYGFIDPRAGGEDRETY